MEKKTTRKTPLAFARKAPWAGQAVPRRASPESESRTSSMPPTGAVPTEMKLTQGSEADVYTLLFRAH